MSSQVWALGLGDIRLQSALNEPLRAEIVLLSATPDELGNLKIVMASAETFERYGLDRPVYLQDIQFQIVRSGRVDGNVVKVSSATAMAEPFLTFLVEATWSRGRLLREYTVLLDPPTFATRAPELAPAVQAPSRAAPADSGQIRRPAPTPQRSAPAPTRQATPAPAQPQPEQQQQAQPQPVRDETPYDTTMGGDYTVVRSETLWGIASRVRPDGRLTMNQTMLAIFEANPAAFGGNINVLKAGASLRIPSADEIIRIDRGDALAEAQRQHQAWDGGVTSSYVAETVSRPSLTLVPPDDDYSGDVYGADSEPSDDEPELSPREQEIGQRIAELEGADVPQQQSLIEIRDNELAALRDELARIRGEIYEPPVDEVVADDSEIVADDATPADDSTVDEAADDTEATAVEEPTSDIIRATTRSEPSLVEKAMGLLKEWWIIIAGVVVLVGGALFWFMRRESDDDDDPDSWQPLDSDEAGDDVLSATETLRAPLQEESIMVVEQQSGIHPVADETTEVPAPDFEVAPLTPVEEPAAEKEPTGSFDSLEDTFSSETAINLDQSDPIAEADFHMAYGLYDQAADLVNGALEIEPDSKELLTKLSEIYFVWGNRDAFVDAAGRLKAVVGDGESADWDKIVIMGQQIAADDVLFAGASAAGATKEVDLSFDASADETGALDMEFIDDSGAADEIVDLGSGDAEPAADEDDGVDFLFDDEETEVVDEDVTEVVAQEDAIVDGSAVEAPDFDLTAEMPSVDETAEMPSPDSTVETPTIEQQFDVLGGTAELPSLDGAIGEAIEDSGQSSDETAEINLDDLDLGIDDLAETELASLDDLDATGESPALSDTGINKALDDLADVTGKNPEVDPEATGVQQVLDADETGVNESLADVTGLNTALDEALLDATGVTQVLSEDFAVETAADVGEILSEDLADDAETLLASLDDDEGEGDFDFAKTEALPKDVFTGNVNLDETGELPAVASTDVDLDLDDLTAALKVSELAGDTIEQMRDDATVEQPRPDITPEEDAPTLSLGPEDMSEDLHDARTMTEVGTKLDLARAYVDMGDPSGARSILEEVLDEGDEGQRQQAQQLLDSLPS
jgi:pilus assembly protein FimV